MTKVMTQVKFTIEADIVAAFKARCTSEGASMASVIRGWMMAGQPIGAIKIKTVTRRHRRKAVVQIVSLLTSILDQEVGYRDAIPEQFEQRIESADHTCDQLAEAIACLEESF